MPLATVRRTLTAIATEKVVGKAECKLSGRNILPHRPDRQEDLRQAMQRTLERLSAGAAHHEQQPEATASSGRPEVVKPVEASGSDF